MSNAKKITISVTEDVHNLLLELNDQDKKEVGFQVPIFATIGKIAEMEKKRREASLKKQNIKS